MDRFFDHGSGRGSVVSDVAKRGRLNSFFRRNSETFRSLHEVLEREIARAIVDGYIIVQPNYTDSLTKCCGPELF